MFVTAFHIELSLKVGSIKVTVLPGDVRAVDLRLTPWGLTGSVEIWLEDSKVVGGKLKDPLKAHMTKHELTELKMKIVPALRTREGFIPKEGEPIEVTALVTHREWAEIPTQGADGARILSRRYHLAFADRMRALWGSHFPCDLYVGKSFRKVVDAQVCGGIKVTHKCRALETKEDLLFLGLGVDEARASFYDLLLWRLHACHGALLYDAEADAYTLADAMKTTGRDQILLGQEVAELKTVASPTLLHDLRVLNADAQDAKPSDVKIKEAVKGLRRDVLIRAPIPQRKTAEVNARKAWARQGEPHIELSLSAWPKADLRPGRPVTFNTDTWPAEFGHLRRKQRSISLHLSARTPEEDRESLHGEVASYEAEVRCTLEPTAAVHPHLPPFTRPDYPLLLEGFVVSEKGKKEDRSYQAYENAGTRADEYKVRIPLFKDLTVVAPFEPAGLSGHFYFPAYKDQRVLVALYFDHATVDRFLDWRPGARLPKATQGNHLLMGLGEDSSTSLEHAYAQDKPTFTLTRRNKKDTTLIRMEEGKMTLRLEEGP